MRILYHSWEFGPGTGGIGQYIYQMACGISKFGHEAIVVTGCKNNTVETTKNDFGVVCRVYDKNDIRTPWLAEKVLEIAIKYNVDCIEGTDHLGECATLLSRLDRPPIIIKYHSCQFLTRIRQVSMLHKWQALTIGLAALRMRQQIQAEKKCVENADCVIAPSTKIVDAYLEQGTQIPRKLSIIPNMLSSIPVMQEGTEAKRPTLLYVGRIEILKGIQYLPQMVRTVRQYYPDVVLEIAGNDQYARGLGSLRKWLERKMDDVQDSIRFLGGLSSIELERAYRRCWVFVFPTKWDNFPMAILEAMAYAKPIVTTFNGGMSEMLEGTGAAIANPESKVFSEKIVRLLGDKQLRDQIGEASRQRVMNNYMPEQIVPKYLKFIKASI